MICMSIHGRTRRNSCLAQTWRMEPIHNRGTVVLALHVFKTLSMWIICCNESGLVLCISRKWKKCSVVQTLVCSIVAVTVGSSILKFSDLLFAAKWDVGCMCLTGDMTWCITWCITCQAFVQSVVQTIWTPGPSVLDWMDSLLDKWTPPIRLQPSSMLTTNAY